MSAGRPDAVPDRAPDRGSRPVPLDPACVARFRAGVERLRPIAPGERIALAVSGGPDSMAMLVLAAAAYPGQVLAATVDHGLRAESAAEAEMVAGHAASLGVVHATLPIAHPPAARGNLHAWARQHRYALLMRWAVDAGAVCLATAHHADDQAETFLMRAARGSGVAGLAGIRAAHAPAVGTPVALIRPLLEWRVGDLRAVVARQEVPFVDDPSNADPRYDRARVRTLLRDAPWLDAGRIAASAAYIAEAEASLCEIETWLWQVRATDTGASIALDTAGLPHELKRRLARTALHAVRATAGITTPAFADSTGIEPLLDALDAGRTATHAGVIVSAYGPVWRFAEQPPRRGA